MINLVVNFLITVRLRDISSRSMGYIITLTGAEIIEMLIAKSKFDDAHVETILDRK